MELILLEKVEKLGKMGDVVTVKDGFGRNFLMPQKKAIRATKDNLEFFEKKKAELEAENKKKIAEATKLAETVKGHNVIIVRQAGDDGRLYGSVTARDVVAALHVKTKAEVHHSCVQLNEKFKEIGAYIIQLVLHAEVVIDLTVNIARSIEEAEMAVKEEKKESKKEEKATEAAA